LTSRFIQADGLNTHYLEAGEGPPLVLVHGGGAGADAIGNWQDCIPIFAKTFHVFAVDMVGFGQTDKPSPDVYDYDQVGRNRHLQAFIEALDLGPVSLIGNSMGGASSIGVALSRPERVKRMVLMGSAGLPIPERPSPELMANLNYDFTYEGMRRVVKGLTGPNYRPPESLIQHRYDITAAPDAKAALDAINAWTKKGVLNFPEDQLRTLKLPILVVNGKQDGVSPLARAYRFLELFENSWGYIVPDCGHWAMVEQTADFCAVVNHFLGADD
jgi:2-hydroxy-6-oxo-6-(2'-aminophenyl)hexa-2,4-dienoate hydrolase